MALPAVGEEEGFDRVVGGEQGLGTVRDYVVIGNARGVSPATAPAAAIPWYAQLVSVPIPCAASVLRTPSKAAAASS